MKKQILTLLMVLTSIVCFGQSSLVYFEKNESSLTGETKLKLDSLIQIIKQSPIVYEIGIIGHTDSDASYEYNKELSLNRARKVNHYLSSNGLKNRFHIISKSESELINNSVTELEKSKNRRVEIIVDFSTYNTIYEALESEYQLYNISPNIDTSITCRSGTILDIETGIFRLANETSDLTIKVKEFYNKADFLASNLTTLTSQNELLESRGMINIEVYQNGKRLQLKENKTLGIIFKDRKINDETSLFIGLDHNNETVWNQLSSNDFSHTESGWSVTYIGSDTISRSRWWYEDIGGETFKIKTTTEKGIERYDTLSIESEKLMKELILSTSSLGWINCDRLYKSNQPKTDLIVEFHENFTPDVSLVFAEINSVLPYSYREDNKLVFKNVPIGMEVYIIGLYKSDKQSDIYFANKNAITMINSQEKLVFELVKETELKEKISIL